MQKLEIHPPSLLAGTALTVIAFVAMALAPASSKAKPPTGFLPARDMVQIKEDAVFVVPAGRILVVTALGNLGSGAASLYVNGVLEMTLASALPPDAFSGVSSIPLGFSVQPGSVVAVVHTGSSGSLTRAWGYLDRL